MTNQYIIDYYKNIYLKKLSDYNNACINDPNYNYLNEKLYVLYISKSKYESLIDNQKKLIKK